jgi:hypothetical protein
MQKSKLVFSATELQLASDSVWILTKNSVIEKVYILFGELSEHLIQTFSVVKNEYPEVFRISPKISKGEKYNGLPWVMLDYPRYFQEFPGHFAMRTFFWWGNYFLIQLQFSKQYIPKVVNGIYEKIVPEHIEGYQIHAGFTLNLWDNTLPQPGLSPLENKTFAIEIPEKSALKIAIKVPIQDWASINKVSKTLADIIVKVLLTP